MTSDFEPTSFRILPQPNTAHNVYYVKLNICFLSPPIELCIMATIDPISDRMS